MEEDEHLVLVLPEVFAKSLVVLVALHRLEEVGELLLRIVRVSGHRGRSFRGIVSAGSGAS